MERVLSQKTLRQGIFSAIAIMVCVGAQAQTVDEIVAKAIAARGGAEAIRAIQTQRMVGQISFGTNPPGAFVVDIKRPGKMREEIGFGTKTLIQTTDGRAGWRMMIENGTGTPVALTTGEVKTMAGGADIDGPLVDYKSKGSKIELAGKESVDGHDTYKLKVTDKTGEVRYDSIDSKSFLEMKWEGLVENAGKIDTFVSYFSDYHKVNGVMFAFAISSGTAERPGAQQITFTSVKLDDPMDESLFAKPSAPASTQKPTP